jgi:hypothetical protein
MAAAARRKPHQRKRGKSGVLVWVVIGVFVLALGVLALNVTQRARRVRDQAAHTGGLVQDALKHQEAAVKTSAKKGFSPAFLQMAFGDNPPLLEQIKTALNQALSDQPQLLGSDVAMMLVTYRAEGELRDVAIHIFGNLTPAYLPAFSREGYWKSQLPPSLYQIGQSMLSLLGREVVILATKDVEKRQRELLEAGIENHYAVVEDYFHDPVSFIAVIPEPQKLFSDRFRPYMAAVLLKGKLSMDDARGELIALSFDQKKAKELGQLLSDVRMLGAGIGRVRYGGSAVSEDGLQSLLRAQIRVEGPMVSASTVVRGEVIERGLPRVLQGLSKGINRIKRGPGYPS